MRSLSPVSTPPSRFARALCLALLAGLLAAPAGAVQLKHRTLNPPSGSLVWQGAAQSFRGTGSHVLVRVKGALDSAMRDQARSQGLNLLQPLGNGLWIAVASGSPDPHSLNLNLDWASPIDAIDKKGPGVRDGQYGPWSQLEDGRRVCNVIFHRDVDTQQAGRWLRGLGIPVGAHVNTSHGWTVGLDDAELQLLLNTDEVLWIQETSPPLEDTNNGARTRTHADVVQAAPYSFRGEDVTVTVYDGGLVDVAHSAFEGRAIIGTSESGSVADHPTHVAGSVGCNHSTYWGMAPACDIVSYEYESCTPNCLYDSPSDIEADHGEAINVHGTDIITVSLGANIYSNGYPCNWQGDYETVSALIDEIVDGSLGRSVIMTWAAGNERGGGPCGSSFSTMSVPSGAKNPIVVGATVKNTSDSMTSFSSWGPTDDGRVKPDVCAPGESINSTFPGNGTGNMSGTSMATPITAGCTAQLVQAWRAYVPGSERLSPALAKTLLVQTADDRGNTGPDYMYGYGRINVEQAVDALRLGHWLEDRVGQDEVREYSVTVAPTDSRLQVSLSWTDWPGAYLDLSELVDDLDLELVSPSQQLHAPWVLNPASPASAATTGTDALNTVEQVTVNTPEAGIWTIRVTGSSIALDQQDFAIVADLPLQADNTGVIAGMVSDSETSQGLEALVRAQELPGAVMSTVDGSYALRLPVGRNVTLECLHASYLTATQAVLVGADTTWVDFSLEARPSATLSLSMLNGASPLPGAAISISNELGQYGDFVCDEQGQLDVVLPAGTSYDVLATYSRDDSLYTDLSLEMGGSAHALQLEGLSFLPSDVDNSGYQMVDNLDIHPGAPDWAWIEIDPDLGGTGTVLDFSGDDQTQTITLPFTFTHYGVDYTTLSICGNGWVSMGTTTDNDWSGDPGFPDPDGPPAIIAPFWEDLSPQRPTSGNICWQYLADSGELVVQFTAIEQFTPTTAHETFQVILRDPSVWPTASGNGQILFQYGELDDITEIAVGIENEAEDAGLQVYNNGEFHPNAPAIAQGTAILFTSIASEGVAAGQVTLFPEDAELLAQTRVASLGDTISVNPDGSWMMDGLLPGQRPIWILGPAGVESVIRVGTVPVADTLWVPEVTLWQLGAPVNTQLVDLDGPLVTLAWQQPEWFLPPEVNGNAISKGPEHSVDDFLSWRVYRKNVSAGEPSFSLAASNLADTTWTQTLTLPGVYEYRVAGWYAGGESQPGDTITVEADFTGLDAVVLPLEFYLGEPYPNPFNSSTRIAFGLPVASHVRLAVYNLLGQEVELLLDGELGAGHHQVSWDGTRFASGTYLLGYRDDSGSHVRRLLQIK
ncbi:MAG: S8 family peptidase [Candidatus Delongbacteria bacterium]|nr:S8 family peptidase [Candidatus Delongbacteria bacterium]